MTAREWLNATRQRLLRARLRGQGVWVHPQTVLELKSSNFSFSKGVSIGAFSYVGVGPDLSDSRYDGGLFLGQEVYVGEWNNIRAWGGVIRVGDFAMISQNVSIIASNHQIGRGQPICKQPNARDKTGVTIGRDVWLSAGCTVLPGVEVGEGAVIAAGAIVCDNVPPFCIYGGVPAKFIRNRE